MTKRDEIIQLARIAGVNDNGEEFRFYEFRYLERFANLIAARAKAEEKEACAKVAWFSYMDACKKRKFAPADWEDFLCASDIRARKETGS